MSEISGINYHRARYYDPRIGAWLSLDPLETANRYNYTDGDPINTVDLNGYSPCFAGGIPNNTCLDMINEIMFHHYSLAHDLGISWGANSPERPGIETNRLAPLSPAVAVTRWHGLFNSLYSSYQLENLMNTLFDKNFGFFGIWTLEQIEQTLETVDTIEALLTFDFSDIGFVIAGSPETDQWGIGAPGAVWDAYHGGNRNFPYIVFDPNGYNFDLDSYGGYLLVHELGHQADRISYGGSAIDANLRRDWGWTDNSVQSLGVGTGRGLASEYGRQNEYEDFAEVFAVAVYYFEAGGGQAGQDRISQMNGITLLNTPNAPRRCYMEALFGAEWRYPIDNTQTACEEFHASQNSTSLISPTDLIMNSIDSTC